MSALQGNMLGCQCCDEQSYTDRRDVLSCVTMLGHDAEFSSDSCLLRLFSTVRWRKPSATGPPFRAACQV